MTSETFHAGPGLGRLSDVTIVHGDCLDAMAELAADSVDAIVTDPPYGLGFMGKAWDDLPPGVDWAKQCLRVLKPGGHLLAFGGTRTWHRLAVAVEDAGFEIRDSIAWLYGSGFPKSLDVSKAIDKAAGATREVVGRYQPPNGSEWNLAADESIPGGGGTMGKFRLRSESMNITAPATPEAEQWSGWGTALKPAFEPIVVARKPLRSSSGGSLTVAANVLEHGTGALNIDATRIGTEVLPAQTAGQAQIGTFERGVMVTPERTGRWPANVVLDADQAAALDQMSGDRPGFSTQRDLTASAGTPGDRTYGAGIGRLEPGVRQGYNDTGGASRFFKVVSSDPPFLYCAKAPKKERPTYVDTDGKSHSHPTVKPLSLMRWLVRLVTPPGGLILDPFAGSGTTVEAALLEGFRVVGIERGGPEGTPESHYLAMIQQRIVRCLAT